MPFLRSSFCLWLTTGGGLLLAISAAAAGRDVITHASADGVRKVLAELGFTRTRTDKDGDIIVRMHGYRVLLLVGSYSGTAIEVRFGLTGTNATLEDVNQWNHDMRFSRAYIDEEGDPVLESDLDLEGGVTRPQVKEFLQTYSESMAGFLDMLSGEEDEESDEDTVSANYQDVVW